MEQLLDDLNSAIMDRGQHYSLQPVIVAKEEGETVEWEVIDGQQRLTTLHLILRYLEAGEFIFRYETRADSTPQMLEMLRPGKAPESEIKWNEWVAHRDEFNTPDNYHLFHAWQAIAKWFQKGNGKNLVASDAGFAEKLKTKVTVIWHVVEKTGAARKFIHFNDGKIALMPCELAKAILLSAGEDSLSIRTPQEIAAEWDQMEIAFGNEEFWWFLNPDPKICGAPNRMVLLFELLAKKKDQHALAGQEFLTECQKHDEDRKWVVEKWLEVRRAFLTLQEWFNDREIRHAVGFLRWSKNGGAKATLHHIWEQGGKVSRSAFRTWLISPVKSLLPATTDLDGLRYRQDDDVIHRVLLWFNIQALPKWCDYPFAAHATVKTWSLEHIHAQHPPEDAREESSKDWLNEVIEDLSNSLKSYSQTGNQDDGQQRKNSDLRDLVSELRSKPKALDVLQDETIKERVLSFLPDFGPNEVDSLANLCLIGSNANSALGNHFFHKKRKVVFEEEKNGTFIPPATMKVFLKAFDGDLTNMRLWTRNDRVSYRDVIKDVIQDTQERTSI